MAKKGREAGPGWPEFIEEKPVGYYDKPCSIWQRIPYQSKTGGVTPMWLEGREAYMVERMRGMTPERRAHRVQFLKDQILSDREPVFVPELHREYFNPIRRMYRYPLAKLVEVLEPKIGYDFAAFTKRTVRNFVGFTVLLYAGTYFALFYANDWIHFKRTSFSRSKPVVYPGDPNYPYVSDKKVGEDYYDLGFKASKFYETEDQVRAIKAEEEKAKKLREARMIRKEYM